ncbi:5-formyltetrahydrofolate cyclo-ligase [Arcobacter roscoffensis]|uniref:5-formyltetrahydrofolate cyclo-ligase n=1 Tax=Arcobacter roscoffensis TaxID=2961520 RepID=A0ABY5E4D4_9BACT|nr:5-formyltetrahydrofolate cyclo-ligase [Arcobacter roscoffensis]UTJ05606.1 5-formyltetrahydrofolate cyclo-ligase [Arcobacter roscoffensis]
MNVNHKSDFRKSCIKKLEFSSRFSKFYKDKIIIKKLENLIDKSKAKNILLYIPLGTEVDTKPLINKLRKNKNKNIYVPFMYEDSFKIVKYRLPLHRKKFGIKEPNNSFYKAQKIDMAIIPIVGVDIIGKRIGFGKGMYDRFFDRLGYKPILVFTQLTLCKSDEILSEKHDIQADYIITS